MGWSEEVGQGDFEPQNREMDMATALTDLIACSWVRLLRPLFVVVTVPMLAMIAVTVTAGITVDIVVWMRVRAVVGVNPITVLMCMPPSGGDEQRRQHQQQKADASQCFRKRVAHGDVSQTRLCR